MTNPREKILLVAFVSALVLAGVIIGGNVFLTNLKMQQALLEEKESKLREAEEWNAERETWLGRGAWLDAHPMPAFDGQQSEAAFVQETQASLSSAGLEIMEQRIQESSGRQGIVEVGIDLIVQSTLEQFVRWLHEIRRAGSYRAVRHIRIRSDGQASTIRAEVSLVRYYEAP